MPHRTHDSSDRLAAKTPRDLRQPHPISDIPWRLGSAAIAFVCACASTGSNRPAEEGNDSGAQSSPDGAGSALDSGTSSGSDGAAGLSRDSSTGGDAATSSSSSGGSGGSSSGTSSGGFLGGAAAKIHDDFESGSLSKWTITDRDFNPFSGAQTVVTVDTTRAHSGTHSVKITPSNGSGGLFGTAPPGASFYGRAWVYMDADPGMGHWEGIVARGPARNSMTSPAELRLGGQFDILYMNDNQTDGYFLTNPNFFTDHMGMAPPVSKWVCEEFYFGDDTVKWWVTDATATPAATPFLDIEPTSTWYQGEPPVPWSPTYATIAFGYGIFGSNTLDVWYDDVAIDTGRIGCN
jgi:hypothetical protein